MMLLNGAVLRHEVKAPAALWSVHLRVCWRPPLGDFQTLELRAGQPIPPACFLNAMVTTLPGHEDKVKIGTPTVPAVPTLNGGDAMDRRSNSTPGDPPVVNNGSGVTKGLPPVPTVPPASSASSTVIQTSFVSPGSVPHAPAVRPPTMQAATINGNNSEPLQTVIQTHTGSVQVSPGPAKTAGLIVRGGAPVTGGGVSVAAPAAVGVRTIAPQQVLAPRLPQSTPSQPSIQNIQLPAGTSHLHVLVIYM